MLGTARGIDGVQGRKARTLERREIPSSAGAPYNALVTTPAARMPGLLGRTVNSDRTSKRIDSLFAIVIERDGVESVVRRDTAHTRELWVTDDPALAPTLLVIAREDSGFADAYVARFDRVG